MKTFEETKKYIVDFATSKRSCSGELGRAKNATNENDLLAVIRDNIGWVIENKLFNGVNIMEYFEQSRLIEYNIGNIGIDNTGLANSGDSNSGNWNSGDSNSGNRNSGDSNSGNWNSGDSNSGNRNSGNWNSGYRNSGDSNSGYRNSGYSNSGDKNSGDSNSGYRNSGNWNSGYRNSGDSNSGYRSSGAFCTESDPKLRLFDKETNITVREWEQMEPCRIMNSIDPTIWVQGSIMTEEEKQMYPKWETTDGYLKTITMHEAWANLWGDLPDEKRKVFTDLPNFDADKFKEITGIQV